jgi:two-component system CheB/CheR fusion protein
MFNDPDLLMNQSLTSNSDPADRSDGQQHAVLIVDDSIAVSRALSSLIQRAGWQAVAMNCAEDALAHVSTSGTLPAAAVIDIHLPDMNGLVLSQKLREALGPERPIVLLSGDTSTETIRSLPHVGATYFFSKPVNGRHLIDKLRDLLGANADNSDS